MPTNPKLERSRSTTLPVMLWQRTPFHPQQSSWANQDERLCLGSEKACLKLRRACYSVSLQTKGCGSHKIEMVEERKQSKGNTMITLEIAINGGWVEIIPRQKLILTIYQPTCLPHSTKYQLFRQLHQLHARYDLFTLKIYRFYFKIFKQKK